MAFVLRVSFFLILIIGISNCQISNENKASIVTDPFMGMMPSDTPKLLAPQLLASSLVEYNGTFSPDGTEFYFTTNLPSKGIITYTKLQENNTWSEVKTAAFSGEFSEYDPLFSPDGKRLYFSSERPIEKDYGWQRTNIWYVERAQNGWSEPILVDLGEGGNYFSSITNEGNFYFNQWKNGDIFKYTETKDSFKIEKLPSIVNTKGDEGDPFISPDESYLIFRAYNNGLGQGDLFISFKKDTTWTEPENLGEPINSAAHEMCPYVTTDGKFFIFASSRMAEEYKSEAESSVEKIREKHRTEDNGELNIYYISADFIERIKQKHD